MGVYLQDVERVRALETPKYCVVFLFSRLLDGYYGILYPEVEIYNELYCRFWKKSYDLMIKDK